MRGEREKKKKQPRASNEQLNPKEKREEDFFWEIAPHTPFLLQFKIESKINFL